MSGVVANANATAAGSDLGIHTSRQGNVVACAVATWAIAAVFVGLRFYLRGHLMKVLGREDWTMLLALAFSAGTSASFIVEAHYGLGKHVSALSVSMLRDLTEVGRESFFFLFFLFGVGLVVRVGALTNSNRRPGSQPCGSQSPSISPRFPYCSSI